MTEPLNFAESATKSSNTRLTQSEAGSSTRAQTLAGMGGFNAQNKVLGVSNELSGSRTQAYSLISRLNGLTAPLTIQSAENGLEITSLIAWLAQVRGLLRDAQAYAHTTQETHHEFHECLRAGAQLMRISLTNSARQIRSGLSALMTSSSVINSERTADPTLPNREQTDGFRAHLRSVQSIAADPALQGSAEAVLAGTTHANDAALAILQAQSVLSAREMWRENDEEPTRENAGQRGRERNTVDEVFKDAGGAFGNRAAADHGTGIWDWCGMFVAASLWRGAAIDNELRKGYLHTNNIKDTFNYEQRYNRSRSPRSIWADGRWWGLEEYHEHRGSVRTWTDETAIAAAVAGRSAATIRSGDIVLIDHTNNGSADHIVMVESYDPVTQTLVTIEGNTKGIKAATDGGVERLESGRIQNGSYARTGTGVHIRDLRTASTESAAEYSEELEARAQRESGEYRVRSGNSVYGVGRPSLVDMENHQYAARNIPEALRTTSPQDMTTAQSRSAEIQR